MLQAVKSLFRKKRPLYLFTIYTVNLQRSQIYNYFLKAFFFFCRWFFQIRMSSSIKMRCKKRQLIGEDFSLGDSYCYQGELDTEKAAPRNHLLLFLCCSPQ